MRPTLGASSLLVAAACLFSPAWSYIPAQPTNDTSRVSLSEDFIQVSHGIQGSSSNSFFRSNVSRQLYADNSTQVGNQYAARGALVHFAESNATQDFGDAPWVAYINCDKNESDASMIDDIFTMTRDHGAVAALLYTETSESCLINQDYIDNFEKPIDVYATTKKQAARLISSPFLSADDSVYWFDSQLLNDSSKAIWQQLNHTISLKPGVEDSSVSSTPDSGSSTTDADNDNSDSSSFTITLLEPGASVDTGESEASDLDSATVPTPTTADAGQSSDYSLQRRGGSHPTSMALLRRAPSSTSPFDGYTSFSSQAPTAGSSYLIAVLANQNAVFSSNSDSGSNGDGNDSNSNSDNKHGSNLTGLAMIILYAITGAVTLLFVIVILNGAIKAIRHPERYGPRARNFGHGPPQGRARGISRAILDSFPVIKFGREESTAHLPPKAQVEEVGMRDLEAATPDQDHQADAPPSEPHAAHVAVPNDQNQPEERRSLGDSASELVTAPAEGQTGQLDNPTDVDHVQTCPICVCDFEADEELRVLPCAGRHRFHKDCIDPWLLDISSLCPLCRWDVAQDADDHVVVEDEDAEEDDEELGAPQRRNRRGTFSSRARRMFNSSATNTRRLPSFGQHARDGTGETTGSGFTRHRFRQYLEQIRQGTASRRQNATQAAQDVAAERSEQPASNA